jgi:hypothetical protein
MDSLSDVEFNLKCILYNKKNCFAHNAVAYHFESQTRGVSGQIKKEDYIKVNEFVKSNKKLLNKLKIVKV